MAGNGPDQLNGHGGVDRNGKRIDTRGEDFMPENSRYQTRERPQYLSRLTAPIDAYTLNRAYNGKPRASSLYTDNNNKPHSEDKSKEKNDHRTRLRQLQFYVLVVVGLTIILCLAFGLGFGLGFNIENNIQNNIDRDDGNDAASSRLESEDPNKVPDATISVVVADLQWDESMADTHSQNFKRSASAIERSMDSYFLLSNMTELYDYAVVSELWKGSVGCNARIYLHPPIASTSKKIVDIYLSIRNGSGVQKIIENLRMGQEIVLSASHQDKVIFMFDTLKIIAVATTTNTMSTSTIATTSTTIGENSDNQTTGTTPSSGTTTVTGTVGTTPSVGTTTVTGTVGTTPSNGTTTVTGTTPSSGTTTVTGTVGTTPSNGTTTVTGTTPSSGTTTVTGTVGTTPSNGTTTVTGTTPSSGTTTVTGTVGTTPSNGTTTVTGTVGTTPSNGTTTVTGTVGTTPSNGTTTVTGTVETTPSNGTTTVTGTVGTTPSNGTTTVTGTVGTTPSSRATTVTGTVGTTPSNGTTTVTGTVETTPSNGTTTVTGTVGTTRSSGTTTVTGTVGTSPSSGITTVTVTSIPTTSSEAETTPADITSVSIVAVFYIEDGELTGNLSDKLSQEYFIAVALVEEEIRQSFHDASEGDNLKNVTIEGFWLDNQLIEVILIWKELNATDLEGLQEKFTKYHEARVQDGKSNIKLKIESFKVKIKDDCPLIFSDACSEFLQALNATGRSQANICGNYADLIQCLYFTYQSKGLNLCDTTTLDQHLKNYSTLIMDIFGANIILCDISNNNGVDLAVVVQFTLHTAEWNISLKDKTSSQFKYLSDKVTDIVNKINFNITVFEILYFNREGETITASAILSIVSYVKIGITLLTKQLQLNLQLQQQSINMTFLELVSAEWVKDLTAVLKQTELWVWYNSKWNPVCQSSFPVSAVDVVCRQLGYSHGLVYQGLFKENSLALSNITCNGSIAQKSLAECGNKLNSINMADCVVANMNCFNTLMHYELVGGDETTFGYVRVKWDNKDGLLCSSGDHSDAMATYLCRDINSTFYGGSSLQTSTFQKPAESDVWKVEANCYRPETDSTFSDCIQSGWQFLQNVTYYSISLKDDIEQPPFMPDSSVCPLNTITGTTKSSDRMPDLILDSCLVKVYCYTKPVAIYQGPFSNSGYIFATNNSDPQIFCRNNFTDLEAAAACKTLGYKNGGTSLQFNPIPWFDSIITKYNNYDYKCSENETLQECNKTEIDLIKRPCSGPAVVKCVDNAADNKDWDVKIGNDGYTLLLYYKNQWGTVCQTVSGKPWSTKEATVVCQALGYANGVPRSFHKISTVSLPHLITNVTCPDKAAKLSDCTYDEVLDNSCSRSYAAEVSCYNSSDVAYLELVGGPEVNSGLVKVTWQNVEGYLCTWSLDVKVSTVMCHSFGFISGAQDTSTYFTDPHLQYIWQTDFDGQCNQNDVLAETCRSATWVKYSANLSQTDMKCVCPENYIALHCYGKVKVSLEPRKNYGPLLIYSGNDYHSVCHNDLNQNAADAACREVTRHNTSNAVILDPGTFLLDDFSRNVKFTCAENAITVSDCTTFLSGSNFECTCASVLCYEGPETPGATPELATEWRIENLVVQIKAYGLWGTICADEWTYIEATVLCKTINSEYTIAFTKSDFRLTALPMWLSSVSCGGDVNTTDINMCTKTTFPNAIDYCEFGGVAVTLCFKGEIDVPKFILADSLDTAFYEKGHVAVTRNNLTGYFCPTDTNLIANNPDKLCNIIGYDLGGQVSQEKIIQNEYPLIWNGSYDCSWNIPGCFLNGNFTERMSTIRTDLDEDSGNSASDVNRNTCDIPVPDILCFKSRVRLQNPELSEGFLLIKGKSGWSGVCADNFTLKLAERFCSDAGYQSGNYTSAAGMVAGFGDIICTDNAKFKDCNFTELTSDLSELCHEIVFISCFNFTCSGNCTQNGNSTINP